MRNVSDRFVEEITTQMLGSVTFFPENRAVYEIMWKNILDQARRIACWITKATHTHSDYVILNDFPLQQCLQGRASIQRLHVHCLHRCNQHGVFTARYDSGSRLSLNA